MSSNESASMGDEMPSGTSPPAWVERLFARGAEQTFPVGAERTAGQLAKRSHDQPEFSGTAPVPARRAAQVVEALGHIGAETLPHGAGIESQ